MDSSSSCCKFNEAMDTYVIIKSIRKDMYEDDGEDSILALDIFDRVPIEMTKKKSMG